MKPFSSQDLDSVNEENSHSSEHALEVSCLEPRDGQHGPRNRTSGNGCRGMFWGPVPHVLMPIPPIGHSNASVENIVLMSTSIDMYDCHDLYFIDTDTALHAERLFHRIHGVVKQLLHTRCRKTIVIYMVS